MRNRLSVVLGIVAAALCMVIAAGSATAQPGADSDTRSDDARIVTIRGCVEGTLLTVTDLPAPQAPGLVTTVGDRFQVVGDRELLDELRHYSGFEVDLIGVLRDELGQTRQRAERHDGGGSETRAARLVHAVDRGQRKASVQGRALHSTRLNR